MDPMAITQLLQLLLRGPQIINHQPPGQRDRYNLITMERHRDDEAVKPLIFAREAGEAALRHAKQGSHAEAVASLAAFYRSGNEYVLGFEHHDVQILLSSCEAVTTADLLSSINARSCTAHLSLLIRKLDIRGCIKVFSDLIKKAPRDSYLWETRSALYAFSSESDKCQNDLREAIRLEGGRDTCNPVLLLNLGKSLSNSEKSGEAFRAEIETSITAFIQRAPITHRSMPDAYYALAIFKVHGGTSTGKAQARELYSRGLEAEKARLPFHPPVQSQHKTLLELGMTHGDLGGGGGARSSARPAGRAAPAPRQQETAAMTRSDVERSAAAAEGQSNVVVDSSSKGLSKSQRKKLKRKEREKEKKCKAAAAAVATATVAEEEEETSEWETDEDH